MKVYHGPNFAVELSRAFSVDLYDGHGVVVMVKDEEQTPLCNKIWRLLKYQGYARPVYPERANSNSAVFNCPYYTQLLIN